MHLVASGSLQMGVCHHRCLPYSQHANRQDENTNGSRAQEWCRKGNQRWPVIWLHTFGERFADPAQGRPSSPPRLPKEQAPRIPKGGAIPATSAAMPDTISYDETTGRLLIGEGYVEHVTPGMWAYEVSGKHVLRQWFSYRKANRERPIMGDRRPPSKLGEIQSDHWLAEYTTELINVLHVLGLLIALEPSQAALLERICSGSTIPADEFHSGDAIETPKGSTRRRKAKESQDGPRLFE